MLQDPSEICRFAAQVTFIIINDENDSLMNRKLIYLKLFCNIIKVFALTFDQFNALLLNKSITPPKKQKTTLNGNV